MITRNLNIKKIFDKIVRGGLCSALCWGVLVAMTVADAWAQNTIKDVRTGQQVDGIRIVLDGTEDFDYDAFLLDSPNRLVIDLKNTQISGTPKIAKNKLISDFRIGNQAKIDGKRLVFELNNNVNIKKKFTIEPQAGQKNWRLVIDLSSQGLSDPSSKSNLNSKYNGAVKRKKIVVLDPGHGGKDPGAIGRSYRTYEKNITLSMGKELQKQLEAQGFKVYMTRSTDIFIPLRKRVAIARNYHADLFISIHADSALNRNARGLSVYTLSETASDKEAEALAERENKADAVIGMDFSDKPQDVATILIDLVRRDTMNNSSILADYMVAEMKKNVTVLPNTHRFAGFAVLKAPDIPSVLVEIGYLSNRKEELMLRKPEYRAKLAASMLKALDKLFKNHSIIDK